MDRIAFDFGFFQVYWYSIFIFLAMFVACIIIMNETRKQKINSEFMVNLLFYGIIFSLIGARLYYVLFNLDYYLQYPLEILEVWNGGLAIHGGIIAGFIWIVLYTKKYKAKTLKVLDICAVGLIVGQAIGRWGNFFNHEVYGAITTQASLQKLGVPDFIVDEMYINGAYRQPIFIYESIWNLTGFFALLIFRRFRYIKNGQITGIYLIWYAIGRFALEFVRDESQCLMLGPFRVAVIASILLFIIGVCLLIFCKKGSRFDGLYKEAEKEEIRF